MKPEDIREYAIAEYFLSRTKDYSAKLSRIPFEVSGARVLDLAAGPGTWTKIFAEAGAERAVWTDRSEQFLSIARKYLRGHPQECRIAFVVSDMTAIPFGDETFDLVYCRLSLHHSEDEAKTLGEVARVLRRGGLLVLLALRRERVKEQVPLGPKKPFHYLSPYLARLLGRKWLPTLYHLERPLLRCIPRAGLCIEICDTSEPKYLYVAARKPVKVRRPGKG